MAKSTSALQARMMTTPRNSREAIRSSKRPLLLVLSWIGLGLSIGTNVTFGMVAEAFINPAVTFAWKGMLAGAALAALCIWAQWVLSPFHRRRPDLIEAGWVPIKSWTMLVGYGNPETGHVVQVYSWGQFFGYLVALAPDIAISFVQTWRFLVMPFFIRAEIFGGMLYNAAATLLAVLTSAASVAPEQIVLQAED